MVLEKQSDHPRGVFHPKIMRVDVRFWGWRHRMTPADTLPLIVVCQARARCILMRSAAFSPIIRAAAFVLAAGMVGMIEASATRRP